MFYVFYFLLMNPVEADKSCHSMYSWGSAIIAQQAPISRSVHEHYVTRPLKHSYASTWSYVIVMFCLCLLLPAHSHSETCYAVIFSSGNAAVTRSGMLGTSFEQIFWSACSLACNSRTRAMSATRCLKTIEQKLTSTACRDCRHVADVLTSVMKWGCQTSKYALLCSLHLGRLVNTTYDGTQPEPTELPLFIVNNATEFYL